MTPIYQTVHIKTYQMSLNKDWTKEDNINEWAKANHRRRDFIRVVKDMPSILLFDGGKTRVGDGWERIKRRLTADEINAVQCATEEDWKRVREWFV